MDMTEHQLTALRDLARKHDGEHVGFINISDARQLTELGLAERTREGWHITDEGLAMVRSGRAGASDPDTAPINVQKLRDT